MYRAGRFPIRKKKESEEKKKSLSTRRARSQSWPSSRKRSRWRSPCEIPMAASHVHAKCCAYAPRRETVKRNRRRGESACVTRASRTKKRTLPLLPHNASCSIGGGEGGRASCSSTVPRNVVGTGKCVRAQCAGGHSMVYYISGF